MADEFDLLIKLLKMTTSSHDNEALSAMRKANAQLVKLGFEWEKLLRGKVTIVADPFASIPTPPTPQKPHEPNPTVQMTDVTWTASARPQPTPRPQPVPVPPRPRNYSSIPNSYDGHCYRCGTFVAAHAGAVFRRAQKWEAICTPCDDWCKRTDTIPSVRAKRKTASVDDIGKALGI